MTTRKMRAGIICSDIPAYLFWQICNKADFSRPDIDVHNNCSNWRPRNVSSPTTVHCAHWSKMLVKIITVRVGMQDGPSVLNPRWNKHTDIWTIVVNVYVKWREICFVANFWEEIIRNINMKYTSSHFLVIKLTV